VLAPYGSRGDVDPLLALGQALRTRGHDVLVRATEEFREPARSLGFAFSASGPLFQDLFASSPNEEKVLWRVFHERLPAQFAALAEACRGAHAVVGAMLQLAAPSIAEAAGIRYLYAVFSPT
jgi:UDP:flavonoid glycosyltransferase YjiC (YdhE family)